MTRRTLEELPSHGTIGFFSFRHRYSFPSINYILIISIIRKGFVRIRFLTRRNARKNRWIGFARDESASIESNCYALVSVSFLFHCRLYSPSFYWRYTNLMFQRSRISSYFISLFLSSSAFIPLLFDSFIHRIN